jgi:murein L,D-transpeptidase YafK
MQTVFNKGPLPRGWYFIGPQQKITTSQGHELFGAMRLYPFPSTDLTGRTGGFIIHGDKHTHNHTGSTGCPVLVNKIRDRIANSGDSFFHVIDCSGDPWDSFPVR